MDILANAPPGTVTGRRYCGLCRPASVTHGVERRFCRQCGSLLTATYDDLPGMIYVSVGLVGQASGFPPQMHSHVDQWLDIDGSLDCRVGSARGTLNARFASIA